MTAARAKAISTWRYPDRYSTYDVHEAPSSDTGYWAVLDEGELVGYCCFGAEARVPGVEEEDGTLDVGYGMRPDLVGIGRGRSFVSAILAFGVKRFSPTQLRLLILDWNQRSRKVAEAHGFRRSGTVPGREGEFLVMTRPGGS